MFLCRGIPISGTSLVTKLDPLRVSHSQAVNIWIQTTWKGYEKRVKKRLWNILQNGQEEAMKKHTKMYRESLGINYENPPTFFWVTSWQHHLQGGAQLLVYNSSFHEFDIYHGYHRLLTQLYQLLYATITCTSPFLLLYSTILS